MRWWSMWPAGCRVMPSHAESRAFGLEGSQVAAKFGKEEGHLGRLEIVWRIMMYVDDMLMICWWYVDDICWWYMLMIYVDDICWWYMLMIYVDDICWWYMLMIYVDDICWWYMLMIYVDDICWWYMLMIYVDDICWWYMLMICWWYVDDMLMICWWYAVFHGVPRARGGSGSSDFRANQWFLNDLDEWNMPLFSGRLDPPNTPGSFLRLKSAPNWLN